MVSFGIFKYINPQPKCVRGLIAICKRQTPLASLFWMLVWQLASLNQQLSSSILCNVPTATEQQQLIQINQSPHYSAPLYFQWQDSGLLLLLKSNAQICIQGQKKGVFISVSFTCLSLMLGFTTLLVYILYRSLTLLQSLLCLFVYTFFISTRTCQWKCMPWNLIWFDDCCAFWNDPLSFC